MGDGKNKIQKCDTKLSPHNRSLIREKTKTEVGKLKTISRNSKLSQEKTPDCKFDQKTQNWKIESHTMIQNNRLGPQQIKIGKQKTTNKNNIITN